MREINYLLLISIMFISVGTIICANPNNIAIVSIFPPPISFALIFINAVYNIHINSIYLFCFKLYNILKNT